MWKTVKLVLALVVTGGAIGILDGSRISWKLGIGPGRGPRRRFARRVFRPRTPGGMPHLQPGVLHLLRQEDGLPGNDHRYRGQRLFGRIDLGRGVSDHCGRLRPQVPRRGRHGHFQVVAQGKLLGPPFVGSPGHDRPYSVKWTAGVASTRRGSAARGWPSRPTPSSRGRWPARKTRKFLGKNTWGRTATSSSSARTGRRSCGAVTSAPTSSAVTLLSTTKTIST